MARRRSRSSRSSKRTYGPLIAALAILLAGGWLLRASLNGQWPFDLSAGVARDARWATPMSCPGVENFHRVSDQLYRGAQPTPEGLRALREMGIKTVVNLRLTHSEADEVGAAGLQGERIAMEVWRPEDEEVVRFLRIATDPNKTPVFVHCARGADRTGTMCAVYRVVVQGWDREDAIREMTQGGYGFSPVWQDLIAYIRNLDAQGLRSKIVASG